MMAWVVTLAAAALAFVLVLLLLGRGLFDPWQRGGLSLAAGGLVWAGVPRLMGDPPGLGDLLFLGGLLLYFGRTYGGHAFRNLDSLDGALDGRLRIPALRPAALRARWAALRQSPNRDTEEASR